MGFNVDKELKKELLSLTTAVWKSRKVKYLGINSDPRVLLEDNILTFQRNMENQLRNWQKLSLSWWGRMAVMKMKILPM